MTDKKKLATNDLTGVVPKSQPPSVGEGTGPPIDDKVCIPKPPATGNARIDAINGVIQGMPNPWVQT